MLRSRIRKEPHHSGGAAPAPNLMFNIDFKTFQTVTISYFFHSQFQQNASFINILKNIFHAIMITFFGIKTTGLLYRIYTVDWGPEPEQHEIDKIPL
jgi:hypothetical protein